MNIIEYRMVEGSRLEYVRTTTEKDKTGRFLSEYRCACGNTIFRARSTVEGKNTLKSCGCAKKDASRLNAAVARASKPDGWQEKLKTHGMTGTPLYFVWRGIVNRCTNPTVKSYKNYGGRGIKICARWHDFQNFYDDMYESYMRHKRDNTKTSIDRIDNDGDYEPSNCRWVSSKEQARNTRLNRFITHNGLRMTIPDWADRIGISAGTIGARLERGWSVQDALEEPIVVPTTLTHEGRTQTLAEWQRELGLGKDFFAARIRRGVAVEDLFKMPQKRVV